MSIGLVERKQMKPVIITIAIAFLLLNNEVSAQVDVEKISKFTAIGDSETDKQTNLILTLKKIKKDSTYIYLERRVSQKRTMVKYFVEFDSLDRLTYLKYKYKIESVDGGGGSGIYMYGYDTYGNAVSKIVYHRNWFKYRFYYQLIYNPSTRKYSKVKNEDEIIYDF